MNRETFMKELEYLLQDISEEEKADALAYYTDYLDEAGPEEEARVLAEFGSPERIAAMIRADLAGSLEDGGGFTERGFEDERFRDPNYSVAPRYDLPEEAEARENSWEGSGPSREAAPSGAANPPKKQRNVWKTVCLVLIAILTFPLWFGLGAAAFGIALGVVAVAAALLAVPLLGLGIWTAAWLFGGIIAVFAGLMVMVSPGNQINSLFCLGTGVAALGVGVLSMIGCGLFYGRFLPWLFRAVIDVPNRLIHRRRRGKKE